ncbi:MAG: DNA repair protein RadC [Peptococcaceae bacterium]|nr:DNA repair protein RadC [Peptococcaceae bacterium]
MSVQKGFFKEYESLSTDQGRKKSISVVGVKVVKEMNFKFDATTVNNPDIAAQIVMNFLDGADREYFVVLLLSTKNKVNGIHVVSVGTLDNSLVHPREVFKAALLSNASSVILAHNHPTGDPTPSREDIDISRRLVEAGKILGIGVLDHIVVGDRCYVSLNNKGII